MIQAADFVRAARDLGWSLWTGTPCSYLAPFINHVMADPGLGYLPASNEGEAVAIAAGAELAGRRGIALFQNSGLGNAVNPLTSLAHTHRIPVLLIVTLRGEPGGPADEPQHGLMGGITTALLDLMQIRWEFFPHEPEAIHPCLARARAHLDEAGLPYALVMRKDAVAPCPAPPAPAARPVGAPPPAADSATATATRRDYLAAIQARAGERDLLVATTGYTGRELYALADRPNQFYLVGAMGCASSVGLGLALARPDLNVTVLDGDGAALMRLGALAAIGYLRPPNLLHVVLDNGQHESTGGQATVSPSTDLAAVAAACGYPHTARCLAPEALAAQFAAPRTRLGFIQAAVQPGVPDGLPRPRISPAEVAQRLRRHIQSLGAPA
ncbi:MAG: phosphonopyruvate decarboxylase [Betaproteobacteria bacterium]|nr:phosphonopyruvate decarboxylase [Betaproteobacteria bacterium]